MDIKKAITVISRIEEGLPLLSVSIWIFINFFGNLLLGLCDDLKLSADLNKNFFGIIVFLGLFDLRKSRFCELLQKLGKKCRNQERGGDEYAIIIF